MKNNEYNDEDLDIHVYDGESMKKLSDLSDDQLKEMIKVTSQVYGAADKDAKSNLNKMFAFGGVLLAGMAMNIGSGFTDGIAKLCLLGLSLAATVCSLIGSFKFLKRAHASNKFKELNELTFVEAMKEIKNREQSKDIFELD